MLSPTRFWFLLCTYMVFNPTSFTFCNKNMNFQSLEILFKNTNSDKYYFQMRYLIKSHACECSSGDMLCSSRLLDTEKQLSFILQSSLISDCRFSPATKTLFCILILILIYHTIVM